MKNTMKFLSLALIILFYSCSSEPFVEGDPLQHQYVSQSEVTIEDYNKHELPEVSSTIYRSENGIKVNFKAKNLIPNNAYTLWWVVFGGTPGPPNITYATGHISGGIGTEIFFANKIVDQSFSNPLSAEVHLILQSHGKATAGMTFDQIRTQHDGCLEILPSGPGVLHEDSEEAGRCANIQIAKHLPLY